MQYSVIFGMHTTTNLCHNARFILSHVMKVNLLSIRTKRCITVFHELLVSQARVRIDIVWVDKIVTLMDFASGNVFRRPAI